MKSNIREKLVTTLDIPDTDSSVEITEHNGKIGADCTLDMTNENNELWSDVTRHYGRRTQPEALRLNIRNGFGPDRNMVTVILTLEQIPELWATLDAIHEQQFRNAEEEVPTP